MSTVVVRYRPAPEHADDNQHLVEDVFAELARTEPDGLRYATWRLADGTFVHIAETGDANPLANSDAFAQFQDGLGERCNNGEGPNPQQATLVGSYRFLRSSDT